MKRILINCSYSDELRVALVDGAKLFDLDNEFNAQALLKGSIFKATVSRVESHASHFQNLQRLHLG